MSKTNPDDDLMKKQQDQDRPLPASEREEIETDEPDRTPARDIAEETRTTEGLGETINPQGSADSETERSLEEAAARNDRANRKG